MKTQFSVLVTATLFLGACASQEHSLDELDFGADAQGGASSAQELEGPGAGGAHNHSNFGLSVIGDGCHMMRAPVIAIVDHLAVPNCDFGLPAGWVGTPLVAASPWITAALNNMPLPETSPLLDYCKYEYEGVEDLETSYLALFEFAAGSAHVDEETMATDCPVMTQQGGLDTDAMHTATYESYFAGVDAIDSADLANLHDNPSHLYLLDTAQEGFSPVEPHSDMLRSLISELVCAHDPSLCGDLIHQMLVTPRNRADESYEADWEGGGTNGYIHEVNLGIVTAVQDWIYRNEDGDQQTLERGVINLSVGAPDLGLIATDPEFAPMQSLIEASRLAACYGLPIYAAAGNASASDRYCDFDQDLMIPASLEYEGAPLPGQCADWGYVPNWDTTTFPIENSPGLVTAVSGVDHIDENITNHRDLAHTKHVALAERATSASGEVPMTGTSVASAVYAATAQLMGAAAPQATAMTINETMYATGWNTGELADAGPGNGQLRRRLSMCASVDALTGTLQGCTAPAPNPGALASFASATHAAISQAEKNPEITHVVVEEHQGSASSSTCSPITQAELTEPLPEKPVCANCSGEVTGATSGNGDEALFITTTMQSHFADLTIVNAYFHVYDATGLLQTISLSPAVVTQMNDADSTTVIEVNFSEPTMSSAELQIIYQDIVSGRKTSETNTVPVI